MNLTLSLRRFLVGIPEVTATVGSDLQWDSWIFRERLYAMVEGSGEVAVVLNTAGAWTSPNAHNTLRTPRLLIEIYADPTRNSAKQIHERDAGDKALTTFEAIDRYLHNVSGHATMWDDLRIVKSTRLDEPELFDVPDGDGLIRAQVFYAVGVG